MNYYRQTASSLIKQLTSKSMLFYMYGVASLKDRSLYQKAGPRAQGQTSSDMPTLNFELLWGCFAFFLLF